MGQHIRAVDLENPPAHRAIINCEETQIEGFPNIRFTISPCLENPTRATLPVLQIEGVENKKSLLNVIHATVCALRSPITSHVIHIHNVQIARAEQVSRFDFAGRNQGRRLAGCF